MDSALIAWELASKAKVMTSLAKANRYCDDSIFKRSQDRNSETNCIATSPPGKDYFAGACMQALMEMPSLSDKLISIVIEQFNKKTMRRNLLPEWREGWLKVIEKKEGVGVVC